ncbi:GNAT family acetyltransferase [Bacillus pseudomycoides]|uniref:GNAT family acetyltransferase n=1 Tax=Bacillus pseudomycoides TaxID=64104 RepID=A0AA91ZS54_9BACI|nr:MULTISPECIES: GNAT family N-acetyltransferase [Bacillus]PEB51119.1 GNAT family acetyltransferase [Bacillus sp. AFS098217]PED81296.1 GNAT family acetyltransferase [Bacillus pseudomycoides]PEU16686.1 GNAT family acetyltransferase [Bacillus sp. AFS019443]PEU16760.1 GNAT family acetyltransferase [Bacillus sp. AFS014408]PFW60156.1 GNAT family acetyltransferase [Bacillus sp. AFS075034]
MRLFIKEYENTNEGQVKQLIDLCHEESYLLHLLESKKLRYTYAAYHETQLVGMFIAWRCDFHPHCTYFRILTNPSYAHMKIEEHLLHKVTKLEQMDLPLQTSTWETSVHLKEFYERNEFKEIRRTYMPSLTVKNAKNISPLKECNSELYNLQTLSTIISNDHFMKKLVRLVKRNYEETHLDNPVGEHELETWEKMILADDILTEGSFIYLNAEKEIIAYSFLHTSEKNDTLELGWRGTHAIHQLELLSQLALQQVMYANKHGYQFIQGEFDSTCVYGMEILKCLPFEPCPTWITYQMNW